MPGAVPEQPAPDWMLHSVNLPHSPGPSSFDLPPLRGSRARVIGVESRSLSTRDLILDVTDPGLDIARVGVVERHRRTGRVGLGYVSGFGLKRGAIASTVAHDAHNCMVVGAREPSGGRDMAAGVARLAEIGGGQVAVLDGQVVGEVRLPIGGLMSDRGASDVAEEVRLLAEVTAKTLGVTLDAPFIQVAKGKRLY